MRQALNSETVSEIVKLRLQGYTYREIEAEVKCSHRTAGNKFREFIKKAEEVGLMEASSSYGVKEQVEALVEYGKEIGKNGLSVNEAVTGLTVYRKLDEVGISPVEFDQVLTDVKQTANGKGYPLDGLSQLILKSMKAKRETGKSFTDLAVEASELGEKVVEQRQRVEELSTRIKELDEDLEKKLHEAKTTKENINEYVNNKKNLKKHEIDLNDTYRVTILTRNLLKMNFDPQPVIDFYKAEENIHKKREENLASIQDLDKQVDDLKAERNALRKETEKLNEEIAAGAGLLENNLEPENVRAFIETIQKISAKQGVEPRKAYEKFLSYVEEEYDPILALENQLNFYGSRKSNIAKEIKLEEEKLENLRKESEAKQSKLKELEKLYGRGLSFDDLRNWNQIIFKARLTSRRLLQKIEEYGGIQELVEEARAEHSKLEREATQLNAQNATLEKNRSRIQAEIEALTSKSLKEILSNFEKIIREIDQLATKSFETGRDARTHINLRALMDVLSGKRTDQLEALHAIMQMISIFILWAETNNNYDMIPDLQALKTKLLGRLSQ